MVETGQHLLGGTFALLSAFLWAAATLFWSVLGKSLPPLVLNLGKGFIALACMLPFLLPLPSVLSSGDHLQAILFLGVSGLLGITIGDTTFFASLNILGPRRSLLLASLIPVSTALLAMLFLGEWLPPGAYLGAALCVGGVYWVMRERSDRTVAPTPQARGIFYGCISILACSSSVILTKQALVDIPSLPATGVRLSAGTLGLFLLVLVTSKSFKALQPLVSWRILTMLVPVAIASTFFGLWLSLAALQFTTATVASVLNATSPLFILPLSAIFLRERISRSALTGTLLATLGIALLLWLP